MNLKEAYSYSVAFLNGNKVDEADFKALCVVCHIAGIKNSEYASHINDDIIMSRLADMLWRLKDGEPLQYVIGKWDFYESEFYVGKGVLIPRPETEELVEKAVDIVKGLQKPVIIDLCAGSGCIGVSLAKKFPEATVYCIEKSDEAFRYLLKNSENTENVIAVNADISECFDDFDVESADLVISNPPYIKSNELDTLQTDVKAEPKIALDGGCDGLDFYRIINDKWYSLIKNNGYLLLEIGNEQGREIKEILYNFSKVEVLKDIYGNDRIVVATVR